MCGIHGALILKKCPVVALLLKQSVCKINHHGLQLAFVKPDIMICPATEAKICM